MTAIGTLTGRTPYTGDRPSAAQGQAVRPGQSGDVYFSGRKTEWRKPSILRRVWDKTVLPATFACGLYGVINANTATPRTEAEVREVTTEIERAEGAMLGIEALWAIDLLAYLLTRKKKQVVIAHEMGHDLLARKTNRIFYGPENPDAQVVKVEKSGGGLSTRLRCPRLLDRDRRVALLKNPALAASCSPFERQYVQEYLRARATVDVAGNMLEGYMVGRTIWGTDRADQKNLRDTLKTLVTLEENSNTWPPEKRKRFIADEKRRAYQEAESYLTGLDISKVREVHARMVEDIKNGKRCWTAGELDAYYQQLGLLEN